jgi:hypothetical protein
VSGQCGQPDILDIESINRGRASGQEVWGA